MERRSVCIIEWKEYMNELQELLNLEAQYSNNGKSNSEERMKIHTLIRLKRDEYWRPSCFGDDDCSTLMLSTCPWRIDCGENYET